MSNGSMMRRSQNTCRARTYNEAKAVQECSSPSHRPQGNETIPLAKTASSDYGDQCCVGKRSFSVALAAAKAQK